MRNPLLITLTASLALLASCNMINSTTTDSAPKRTVFFDKAGMDSSVSPADDFFSFANGTWMKETKIPDDRTSWGSFGILNEEITKNIGAILTEVSANTTHPKGSLEQKVGDYYYSGMDTTTIEKVGAQPLMATFKMIDEIKDVNGLVDYAANGFKEGNGDLFGFYVAPDEKNSQMNIGGLYQTETSLPDKSYYFDNDSNSVKIRNGFKTYVTTLFKIAGTSKSEATKHAEDILKLETEIAKTHRSRVELRDPHKNYNKFYIADLKKLSPGIDWDGVFAKMGIKPDSVNVGQPDYYKNLDKLLKAAPLDVWKAKFKFNLMNSNAIYLSKNFRDANFEFFGKTIGGQKLQKPRWKQMADNTDNNLGELLGQLYVKKYFTPEAKERMDKLVSNVTASYKNRIAHLDWMSDATKAKATEKLGAIMRKIGYPEKWKNYDDVTISRDGFMANMISVRKHDFNENLKKLNKPVDRTEWGMTPPTVNAYYNPSYNEIVFPAGILQFPFFDPNADDAINYGGIGMVIGHEITHGFDDQGCQYDAKGNMSNWWTDEDAAKFKTKTQQVIKQYSDFTILDGLHVNGELTVGENLADIGGIAIAYDAFQMTEQAKSKELIDGFTPNQRFFLGFAQIWRVKKREQTMRNAIKTDAHSPALWRINGPLMNFAPFYEAFNVKEGNKMWRNEADRAKVW